MHAFNIFPQPSPNVKQLTNWFVLEKRGGIVVKGLSEDGLSWTTTAIKERIHRFQVKTVSGTVYRLVGERSNSGGIQEKIFNIFISPLIRDAVSFYDEKFSNGFPSDWNSHLNQSPSR